MHSDIQNRLRSFKRKEKQKSMDLRRKAENGEKPRHRAGTTLRQERQETQSPLRHRTGDREVTFPKVDRDIPLPHVHLIKRS